MKLLNVEKQDNIEFYLSCKFQRSTFNVRCKTDVTDGMTDRQTNELPYASALGIITKKVHKQASKKISNEIKWM